MWRVVKERWLFCHFGSEQREAEEHDNCEGGNLGLWIKGSGNTESPWCMCLVSLPVLPDGENHREGVCEMQTLHPHFLVWYIWRGTQLPLYVWLYIFYINLISKWTGWTFQEEFWSFWKISCVRPQINFCQKKEGSLLLSFQNGLVPTCGLSGTSEAVTMWKRRAISQKGSQIFSRWFKNFGAKIFSEFYFFHL